MKGIKFEGQLSSINAKVDGSLGLRLSTPELKSEEKVLIMSLQNLNLDVQLKPKGVEVSKIEQVEKGINSKSPSERLYNVIFCYYKKIESIEDFETFYKRHIESHIDTYKEKLDNNKV